jgi:hypothetical protein
VSRIELQPTRENYRFIQPLPIDNWLVVRSRAQNELDTNAHIYDSSGEKVRSFHAGDAIQDVQTTEDGQIWISYFDEAAAGGVGIGGKGLASFDEKGDLVFGFDELFDKHDLPQIDDCYAMNVSSPNETWICYYMDFPLVKIVDRQLDRVWKDFPIGGASAFAVSKNRVLLAGLYKYPQSLFLVDLTSQDVEELNAVTHAGTPITFSSAFGRGPRLYLRTQTEIFEIDLRKT